MGDFTVVLNLIWRIKSNNFAMKTNWDPVKIMMEREVEVIVRENLQP